MIESAYGPVAVDKKLPVIAERSGWSYSARGVLVDMFGNPIAGASVENVIEVGTGETYTTNDSMTTLSDGTFLLDRVFPDTSSLRVRLSAEHPFSYTDYEITVPWTQATNVRVDLGTILSVPFTSGRCQVTFGFYGTYEDRGPPTSTYDSETFWVFGNVPADLRGTFDPDGPTIANTLYGPDGVGLAGLVTVTFDRSLSAVESFDLTYEDPGAFGGWTATISGGGIPKTDESPPDRIFSHKTYRVDGVGACAAVGAFSMTNDMADPGDTRLRSYRCTDDSFLEVQCRFFV